VPDGEIKREIEELGVFIVDPRIYIMKGESDEVDWMCDAQSFASFLDGPEL
jgi:hypothetical protein